MTIRTSTANSFARIFLFPGDVACSAMGLEGDDKGDLVRMLVNSLVWIVVGMTAAVILA
jgi:hypothetical protein